MMFYALNHLGHDSVLATSVYSTYHCLARCHNFEMILLDLQLGGERSEPMIQRLIDEGFAIPPIIILSAQPPYELQKAAQIVGAKAILQKPASIDEIAEVINHIAA